MKIPIQFLFSIFFYLPSLYLMSQTPKLDVEGDTRIRGDIDINHMDDTTSVFIGRNAGSKTSFSSTKKNTFVGSNAGPMNFSGFGNSFFGDEAGYNNLSGFRNSFFGYDAGYSNTGGFFNSFFGDHAGYDNINGSRNSFFGIGAGSNNTRGTSNTFLGYNAGHFSAGDSLDRSIAIGYEAKVSCSHCAVIGGTGAQAVNVGINTHTPTERLDVNGNARFRSVGTGAYKYPLSLAYEGVLTTDASDRRLKENISGIKSPLEKTLALRGVNYTWKNDETKEVRIGLIAQEVEKILPEVVYTNEVDGYMGVRYKEIVALLIEAIKEQQTTIKAVEKRLSGLDDLEKENEHLKAQLKQIKFQIDHLNTTQTTTP